MRLAFSTFLLLLFFFFFPSNLYFSRSFVIFRVSVAKIVYSPLRTPRRE
jgi:hypothetical protein